MQKILLTFSILFFSTLTLADTWSTPAQLKQNQWNNWQPHNINNGELLSDTERNIFLTEVNTFALAEWLKDAPEGEAQCYYHGVSSDQDYLNAYLAKQDLIPDSNSISWGYSRYHDEAKCFQGIDECQFY